MLRDKYFPGSTDESPEVLGRALAMEKMAAETMRDCVAAGIAEVLSDK